MSFAQNVVAGDWDITPRMTVTEEYTDNVRLDDQNTLSDFITTLTPGLSVRGTGARINMNVDYNIQNQIYADNSDFDRTNQQLQSGAKLEIIKNSLFIDGNASKSQRNGNNDRRRATQNRSRTGNETDVLTYQYGVRFNHHLGNWANFNSSYIRGSSSNSGETTGDAGTGDDETTELSLTSGRRIARTPMSLRYSKRETDFESGVSDSIENLTGTISYVVSRKLTLDSEFGFDKNELGRGSNSRGDGFRWRFGGQFSPSARTTIAGHWGERGFGKTFDVSVRHTMRRFFFTLNYDEELRTASQRLRDATLVPLTDITGEPIFDVNDSSSFGVPIDSSSINEEVSLSKRLRISTRYQMRRSSITASYNESDRVFQTSLQGEETRGFQLSARRELWPRLSGNLLFSWDESVDNLRGTNEILRYTSSLSYSLGPHTKLNLSYQYADSSDDQVNADNTYLENAITANLTILY